MASAKIRDRGPGLKAAYWLTYDPRKGNFTDYPEAARLTRSGQWYEDTWQVRYDKVRAGDRVFILRQGTNVSPSWPARGIVGRGVAISDSKPGFWERDGSGKATFRVSIRLDSVVAADEPPLPQPFPKVKGQRYEALGIPAS